MPLVLSYLTSTLSEELTFNCEARKTREIAPTTQRQLQEKERFYFRYAEQAAKHPQNQEVFLPKTHRNTYNSVAGFRELAREIFGGHYVQKKY